MLRALRRQLQARAGAHARSVIRQSPGPGAYDPGQLHRRHDRHHGDARSNPRRDRPMILGAHGGRASGWDRPADLEKDPALIPDPAPTEVPAELRKTIEEARSEEHTSELQSLRHLV